MKHNNTENIIKNLIKSKVKKILIPIIVTVSPMLFNVIILVVICCLVYAPFAAISSFLGGLWEDATEFAENLGNFITFNGWTDNDTAFYNRLEEENNKFTDLEGVGSLDIPLVTATLHYGSLLDPNVFSEMSENSNNDENYEPETIVATENTSNFYKWALNETGSINSIIHPGLLGNMVNKKLVTECKEGNWFDGLAEGTVNAIKNVASSIEINFQDAAVSINFINALYNFYAYDNLGYSSFDAWYNGVIANTYTTLDSFRELFDFSYADLTRDCGEGYYNSTSFRYYVDYDKYNLYLEKYFVPVYYMECKNCKWNYMEPGSEEYNKKVQDIIDEIYSLREFYTTEEVKSVTGLGTITIDIEGFTPRDTPPNQSNSSDDNFWWSGSGTSKSLYGQCTWYVKGRVNEIMASIDSDIRIDSFPDAKNWISDPRIVGGLRFSTSTDINTPKIGAVIVWGGSGSNSFGHVAVIENIYEENGETHVVFSHANTSMPGALPISGTISSPAKGTWALEDSTISAIQNRNGMNFLGYVYTINY